MYVCVVYLERAENSKTEEYLLTIKGSKVESLKGESLKVKSLMDQSKLMKALNVNGSKFKFQKMKLYHISSTIFSIQSQEIQTQDRFDCSLPTVSLKLKIVRKVSQQSRDGIFSSQRERRQIFSASHHLVIIIFPVSRRLGLL